MSEFSILLLHVSDLLPFRRVSSLHAGRLTGEQVLDRQDLVKKLEFLLRDFLVALDDRQAVELLYVLEAVDDEAFQRSRAEHLVVINIQAFKRVDAFNLAQKNKAV